MVSMFFLLRPKFQHVQKVATETWILKLRSLIQTADLAGNHLPAAGDLQSHARSGHSGCMGLTKVV